MGTRRADEFVPMVEVLPEVTGFEWAIEHFEVSEQDSKMTAINMHSGDDFVPPGKYARLVRPCSSCREYRQSCSTAQVVMSDTPMERRTNCEVVSRAHGDVLIAGLGLGMILVPICRKPEVTSVTVLELHREVIDLVLPHLRAYKPVARKLSVIEADVFKWSPPIGLKWDTIYFDIWAEQSTDTLQEITTLKRRFAKRKREGGWMRAWREGQLRYTRDRDQAREGCF